ncbi:hypothetical protein PsAD2_03547 [Pseudovibrio axinellae]|uniref:Uncharacterized protein n=1 Tax=Pseudovibrio axinellae TaxID=989403 RepID=A0A161V933_9HYPH|nr:hypothetical protein PsAD2_03547 [Pseudovibrio axinellae]SER80847.1 hypothetical protein SAMN05421798_1266 [Pseudovibrio axinellae]
MNRLLTARPYPVNPARIDTLKRRAFEGGHCVEDGLCLRLLIFKSTKV